MDEVLSPIWRWILTRLAHGPSFAVLLVLVAGAGITMSAYLVLAARDIHRGQISIDDQPFRNGFVAVSDILRATNAAYALAAAELPAPALLAEFEAAVDILFVRAGNFRKARLAGNASEEERAAVAAISDLVEMLDDGLAAGFGRDPAFDGVAFVERVLHRSEETRAVVIGYLDIANNEQDEMLSLLAAEIVSQADRQVGFASGMTALALLSLLVLRGEARERMNRERAEARARYLAYFDPLTDLPNRIRFRETVNAVLATGTDGAALLLDLDDFKGINDTLGHGVGDLVLRETARRLARIIEGPDRIVARLSGDEFAAWIPSCDPGELAAIGRRIVTECARPIDADGQVVIPGVSVGIAPRDQVPARYRESLDLLLRVSDYALYVSKNAGRGQYTVTDASVIARFTAYRAIIEELPDAVRTGALEVFLQPKVGLRDRLTIGFEALVRWRRGDALLSPSTFIEIAEQNGQIAEIDLFVLESAVRAVAAHNAREGTAYTVNVNLSAVNLNTDRIVEAVAAVLKDTGLPPPMLTLEVTETAMIRHRGRAATVLDRLRRLGVRIAVDDFGAGHASLVYIRTLRPHELKIDRSLVQEIDTSNEARLVLDRVIGLGHGLGIDVVVEGVETESQARVLAEMGCSIGQGFLWGWPVAAEEALARATRQHRAAMEARERESDSRWMQHVRPERRDRGAS